METIKYAPKYIQADKKKKLTILADGIIFVPCFLLCFVFIFYIYILGIFTVKHFK